MPAIAGDTLASALLANGVQAGRPLVQISPPARHPDGGTRRSRTRWSSCAAARAREPNIPRHDGRAVRRAGGAQPEPLASLALRSDGGQRSCSRRCFVAGFYYKTFMWPAAFWEKVYEPLIRRAAGLGRAADAARSRPLREGACLLRRAGHRRRPGRPGRGARRRPQPARASSCATRTGVSAAAAGGAARRSTALPGGRLGATRRWPSCGRLPNVRMLPRTTVFGVYDDGTYGALERVTDHLPAPDRRPAAPAALADRGQARGAGRRRDRAAARVRRQRPARRDAGRRSRTYVNRFAVAAGQTRRRLHQQRRRLGTALDLHAAGVEVAAVVDARRDLGSPRGDQGPPGRSCAS